MGKCNCNLFKLNIEGAEVTVELEACECGCEVEVIDYVSVQGLIKNEYVVQKGKVYEVGEEE